MVERPHEGPLPPAHPVLYGRLPQPDGQTVPQPPSAPVARRQLLPGLIVAAIALVLMAAGVAGMLP